MDSNQNDAQGTWRDDGPGESLPLLIEVLSSPEQRTIAEAALVLQARRVEQRTGRSQSGHWGLFVEEADGARAKAELARYAAENRNWPPTMAVHESVPGAWAGSAWYILLMLAFFAFRTGGSNSWRLGIADAGAILDGQWWLGFSALFLHSDLLHLTSNLVFGSLFGFLVAAEIGSGPAWLGILLAGGLGNIANAVLFQVGLDQPHHSLGASTGVFGAVGILSVLEFSRRWGQPESNLRKLAPLVFGVVLLGMYGLGGENTDVTAHFTGFLAGCAVGGVAFLVRSRLTGRVASACGLATGIIFVTVTVLTWGA